MAAAADIGGLRELLTMVQLQQAGQTGVCDNTDRDGKYMATEKSVYSCIPWWLLPKVCHMAWLLVM